MCSRCSNFLTFFYAPIHTTKKLCYCFDSKVRSQVPQKCSTVHSECMTRLVPCSFFFFKKTNMWSNVWMNPGHVFSRSVVPY